jgi:DNA gyrase inhibitor GyrI
MNPDPNTPLQVEIRELPAVRVVTLAFMPESQSENHGTEIRSRFERVQEWLKGLGLDPYTRLTIGEIVSIDERLLRYDCCVEIPDEVQICPEGMRIRRLHGGRYAVLTITKEPEVITDSIRRLYEQWVPEHELKIDASRPTYEIYWADTMDYCVPLM